MRFKTAVVLFLGALALPLSSALFADASAGASWKMLNDQVQILTAQGNVERAIGVAQQALALAKSEFGAESSEAVEAMDKLAALYKRQSAQLDEGVSQIRQRRSNRATSTVAKQATSSGSNTNGPVNKLVFGLIAPRGVEITTNNWRPFAEAMSSSLRVPVELVAMASYKEVVEAFKAGKIDFAWLSNVPALEVVEAGKGAVFAQTIDVRGSSSYRSVLIVHKESKINSIQDILKPNNGLIFGDGDVKSTSGHLVPLYYAFVQNKVNDPSTLFKEIKSGNFKTNATRVAQREVDVATNNDVELGFFKDEHPDLHAKLRVIWTSQDIPQSPLVWRRGLPVALKRQISDFVVNYGGTEAERKVLVQANDLSGFRKASNRQLVSVSELQMFSEWRKLWNNRDLSPEERKKQERLLSARSSRLEIYLRAKEDY